MPAGPGAALESRDRGGEGLRSWERGSSGGQSGPLLVGAAVAVPQVELRAVGRGEARNVETAAGDRVAVAAVEGLPDLVGAAVAGPELHLGAVGRAEAGGVEALAHGAQGAVGVGGPDLVDGV